MRKKFMKKGFAFFVAFTLALSFNLLGDAKTSNTQLGAVNVEAKSTTTTTKITRWKNGKIKTKTKTILNFKTLIRKTTYTKYNKKGLITYKKYTLYNANTTKEHITTSSNYGKVKKNKRTWRTQKYNVYYNDSISYSRYVKRNAKGIKYVDNTSKYKVYFSCDYGCEWYSSMTYSKKVQRNTKSGKRTKAIDSYYTYGIIDRRDIFLYHKNGKRKQFNHYKDDINGTLRLASISKYNSNGKLISKTYYNKDKF